MGIKQYARHRARLDLPGGTPAAVRRAIKAGRLATSLTADGAKIQSARAADAEWAATTKAEYVPLTGPAAPAAPASSSPALGRSAPRKRTRKRTPDDAPPINDLATARARREAAVAALAEIELAEKRGELVRARDMESHMADVFLRCRTRLLGMPLRLRQQDPTLTLAQLVLVEGLLVEALEELAGAAS